jgi:hypothetical protein
MGSVVVETCQVCGNRDLTPIIFLGYLPPVNHMWEIGERPREQPGYPAELLHCARCQLVQIGLIIDPAILFPPEYSYTSGTTRILCDNFSDLYSECRSIAALKGGEFVIDIGSNDGTLLESFKCGGQKVLGIEPTNVRERAEARGIPTHADFFSFKVAASIRREHGPAQVVTATNVLAHIADINGAMRGILEMLDENGVLVAESHGLSDLIEKLQFDAIYHDHLRYYSLASFSRLLEMHGLEAFHAKSIPTHGGSMRVYAARRGKRPVDESVGKALQREADAGIGESALKDFGFRASCAKQGLQVLLAGIKKEGVRIYGIGAPSRASTLINYVGLDDSVLDCVVEVKGSNKIDKYMPGTVIPVREEGLLFEEQPEYALLLSWHIANELIPKLAQKGFKGKFIVPLPEPRIVGNPGKGA